MPELGSLEKTVKLMSLWVREIGPKEFDPEERWWTFPRQGPIMGFFGVRPLTVIGDQPSTDSWPESHPSRVLLYGTLIKLGVPDAHLTDVIKRRGMGSESRKTLPADFRVHIELLRREIDIIQPFRIVALGVCAEQLLLEHLPEVREKVRRVWHFAFGARPGRAEGFEAQLRAAILQPYSNCPEGEKLIEAKMGRKALVAIVVIQFVVICALGVLLLQGRRPTAERDGVETALADIRGAISRGELHAATGEGPGACRCRRNFRAKGGAGRDLAGFERSQKLYKDSLDLWSDELSYPGLYERSPHGRFVPNTLERIAKEQGLDLSDPEFSYKVSVDVLLQQLWAKADQAGRRANTQKESAPEPAHPKR